MLIPQNLNFHVARTDDLFFHVKIATHESRSRFRLRNLIRALQLRLGLDDSHTPATPTGRRLQPNGIPDFFCRGTSGI